MQNGRLWMLWAAQPDYQDEYAIRLIKIDLSDILNGFNSQINLEYLESQYVSRYDATETAKLAKKEVRQFYVDK